MQRGGQVYIMSSKTNTALYIGVTSNLYKRVLEHKNHAYTKNFTNRYCIEKLVYYESFDRIEDAIAREKQLKGWRREKKEWLINQANPDRNDLFESLSF